MPDQQEPDTGSSFADRLNYLISTYPRPLPDAEICAAIEQQGGHLSATQLGKLRKGVATNPTLSTVHQLATFFKVAPAFLTDFTDPLVAKSPAEQQALQILREKAGVKDVLFRMGSMSPAALDVLATVSKQLVDLNEEHAPKPDAGP